MEITFLGHSSFKIRGKSGRVITDPYSSEMTGFKFPKVEAEVVTISHDHEDHNQKDQVQGNPFVILGPGEYEVKDISVVGISSYHDKKKGEERGPNTIYLIEMDGLRVCHLGDLGHELSEGNLQELDGVDVLFVPVGGSFTLGPKEAVAVISQIEPKMVIPMHYKTSDINEKVFGSLLPLQDFLKEIGDKGQYLPKLQVSRESLPEAMQVIVLERKNE